MKTERFEDKIRKKLESIEPDFQENDWENFQNYSSTKLAINKKEFNTSIFKIAASIALIGTLFLGVSQYFTNNNLTKQVEKLKLQNEQLISKQVELEKTISEKNIAEISNIFEGSENLMLSKHGSIEKEVIKGKIENINENISGKSIINKEEFSNESNSGTSKLYTINANKKGNNISKDFNEKLVSENENYENEISFSSEKIATNKQRKSLNKYSNLAKNTSQNKEENSIYGKKSQPEINNNVFVNSTESDNIIVHNSLILNELKSKGLRIDSTRKFNKMLKKSDFAYYKLKAASKKKMYFTLADAHMRTGLSSNLGKGLFSYGIHSELFLDERISLKVGAKKMNLQGENFITEFQFKNATKRDFREKYNVKIPPTKAILNIKEEYNLFVLPVGLSYYHPLQNGIHLVTSIGSDLDISGSKKIEYKFSKTPFFAVNNGGPKPYSGNGEELDLDKLIEKTEKKLFNNISLSMGAEKRFGKLGLQGKLTDQYLVKAVDYRKKNSLNLELGLNYRL